jgi:hypothetical protein
MKMALLPGELEDGEAEAIATVKKLGARFGYGNLIGHLRDAWSASLQARYGMSKETADLSAGYLCAWCRVDTRTGTKVGAGIWPGENRQK